MADPKKVRYPPEILLDADVVNIPATSGGIVIKDISYYKPRLVTLLGVSGAVSVGTILNITRDTEINKLKLNLGASKGIDDFYPAYLTGFNTIKLRGVNPAGAANLPTRLFYLVNAPEQRRIPTEPKEIITVSETLTSAGGGEILDVGATISARDGEKIILTNITSEQEAAVYDNFLHVDRDTDTKYLSLNTFALGNLSKTDREKIQIPAMDKFHIYLEAGSVITDSGFRYTYEVHDLTEEEKKAWGIG